MLLLTFAPKMPTRSEATNIYLLYVIKFSKWFMLFMPIIVVFFQDNGLDMQQIFILKAINAVTVVALEIPSGYMADVLGRRKTLILGALLNFAGFVSYSVAYGFGAFVVAELLLGISMSLISGADSAMLFDSLKSAARTKDYAREEGRITAIGNFSEAAAGVMGGFLAGMSLRLPFVAQAGVSFIGIPAALLLMEPRIASQVQKASMRAIVRTMRYALVEKPILRAYILFSASAGMTTLTLAWFVQPYFKTIDLPLEWYGVLWTALNLSVGITAFVAYKAGRIIRPGTMLPAVAVLTGGGFLLLGFMQGLWGIGVLFAIYLVRGVATPVLKDYINRHTDSEVRATVLSVRSFIIRIAFAVISPALGWYTDHYNLQDALKMAGGLFLAAMLAAVVVFRRAHQQPH